MKLLIEHKKRAFWILQSVGWLGFGFIRTFNGWALGERPEYAIPSAIAMAIGFLLTLVMRRIYHMFRSSAPGVIISVAVVTCAAFSMIFSITETYFHTLTYDPFLRPQGLTFLGNAMFDAYVLMGWSAIYFGVNYYLLLQRERERALTASSMAHQAQLKMLRYQLNPHFLFNTLNAISTLVLVKDIANANGMLDKLSSFLRYTLVNQPTQKVSLEQELYALGLYLEIEKVRFEDRLKLIWEISDDAKTAVMPSLLLQPLIENAIKYAIAPFEAGGTITLIARKKGHRLQLLVCDTGPGISPQDASGDSKSSGVGIANTRERLHQVYGDQHEFNIRNLHPNGLEIEIMIPFETSEDSN